MKEYWFSVEETNYWTESVFADSEEEARKEIERHYYNDGEYAGSIYQEVDFNLMPDWTKEVKQ